METRSDAESGTVLKISDDGLIVSTATGDVRLSGLADLAGNETSARLLASTWGFGVGDCLQCAEGEEGRLLGDYNRSVGRNESSWLDLLEAHEVPEIPFARPPGEIRDFRSLDCFLPEGLTNLQQPDQDSSDVPRILFGYFMARFSNVEQLQVGYSADTATIETGSGLFARLVPLPFTINNRVTVQEALAEGATRLSDTRRRQTYPLDVLSRYPRLRAFRESGFTYPVATGPVVDLDKVPSRARGVVLMLQSDATGTRFVYDAAAPVSTGYPYDRYVSRGIPLPARHAILRTCRSVESRGHRANTRSRG